MTAIVAESPGAVDATFPIDSTLLSQQLDRVDSAFRIGAMKTGMLANAANVRVMADFAKNRPDIPLVIDPVIRASAGAELLSAEGVETLLSDLFPIATLVTPNLPEVARILGFDLSPVEAAKAFYERFGCSVLVKGGHGSTAGDTIIDYAMLEGEAVEFPHPRLSVPDVHGTGCSLSAAIAARLASGEEISKAISSGIRYLTSTLASHLHWEKTGTRALNHFPDGLGSSPK